MTQEVDQIDFLHRRKTPQPDLKMSLYRRAAAALAAAARPQAQRGVPRPRRLLKAADLAARVNRMLARDTSLWTDTVWVVDSTPVECGRSRETARRSDLAGWAEDGYSASHSRFFWGLRLHLLCTLQGCPFAFALTGAKADERETVLGMLHAEPDLAASRPGQTLISDRQYYGRAFERELAGWGVQLLRPARKGEPLRAGSALFKPLRQIIESVNQTFKA
ncbi:transposase [Kitasatospora sp. NPDC048194]|uniref:transposase n=1 Tax=Kitasatospora sp. NPDC048194 TaxID=3364045 RepID=UPI003721104A